MQIDLTYSVINEWKERESITVKADVSVTKDASTPAIIKAKIGGKVRHFYRHGWSTQYYAADPVSVKVSASA